MSIQKNIGKNTIGDNNKMSVSLHEYNMSTHDLSTIVRNTQSPGTLVPNLCLVGQKGDTFDIDVDANVLTHPTTGPLFGSFKLEHHIYAAPVRLYNSWLHNNRTKIGLNMAQVKLPQIGVTLKSQYDTVTKEEEQWNQVNPSCLLAYLGIRGFANMQGVTTKNISKNALPILAYYDIFKNYYANTQEENFYVIGNSEKLVVTINGKTVNPNIIASNEGRINNKGAIIITPNTIKQNELQITASINTPTGKSVILAPGDIGTWSVTGNTITIATNKVPEGEIWYIRSIQTINRITLESYPLENLDTIRDKILLTAGDTVFDISNETTSVKPFTNFAKRKLATNELNTTDPQYGLCLKTYNSDLYQNWINTEWIEGTNGINEASAVDVSDGTLSMDALNLSQKVYNFLNRIAVSGGTYRDWLETVYTGGNYMERCETPTFEGGVSPRNCISRSSKQQRIRRRTTRITSRTRSNDRSAKRRTYPRQSNRTMLYYVYLLNHSTNRLRTREYLGYIPRNNG